MIESLFTSPAALGLSGGLVVTDRLRLPLWSIPREECDYRISKSVRRAAVCREEMQGERS